MLSDQQRCSATAFLHEHGRPLDRARLAFAFGTGHASDVLAELAHFRNNDGGFGRALEPDLRLADSSVIATTMAMQVLVECDADASDPMVRGAVVYLLDQLDRDALAWTCVPLHVDDAPHAPWWGPEEKKTGFTANPGAEVLAHFYRWSSLVPAGLLTALTDAAMAHLEAHHAELSMHDAFCFEWLCKTVAVPVPIQTKVRGLLYDRVLELVETNPDKWSAYGTRPLNVVASPGSVYHDALRNAVEANLDYLIDTQQPSGAWLPHWSWGEVDSEAWEQSKRDWQGYLIVEHLVRLGAFNRLKT